MNTAELLDLEELILTVPPGMTRAQAREIAQALSDAGYFRTPF